MPMMHGRSVEAQPLIPWLKHEMLPFLAPLSASDGRLCYMARCRTGGFCSDQLEARRFPRLGGMSWPVMRRADPDGRPYEYKGPMVTIDEGPGQPIIGIQTLGFMQNATVKSHVLLKIDLPFAAV